MSNCQRVLTDLHGDAHDTVLVEQWGIHFLMLARAHRWLPVVKDGSWEQDQRELFFDEIRRRDCRIGIDIGANNGIYTLLMCREPGMEKTISFEPCEPHFTMMRESLQINGFETKCTPYRVACSNEKSNKQMYVFPDDTPSLNQLIETQISSINNIRRLKAHIESVETARLDDILDFTGENLAIKIDTEGHEHKVISGAARLLEANQCFVQIESFDERIITTMSALGYRRVAKIKNDHYFSAE